MRHISFVLVLGMATASLRAQLAPETPLTAVTPPAAKASALSAETPAARPHTTSPDLSMKITSAVPKFDVLKMADAQKIEEAPDLREIDKPRNAIIRLPKHIVMEQREPAFKERDLLTANGKLEAAYKNFPGLRFGSLPFLSNNGVALGMQEDELRLERLAEMADLQTLYGDAANRAEARSFANQLAVRPSDWVQTGGSRAVSQQQR